jgi:hypothetical protein
MSTMKIGRLCTWFHRTLATKLEAGNHLRDILSSIRPVEDIAGLEFVYSAVSTKMMG